ncbi:class III poly(R)-hydroxyalkanoic acid synthase subunit PhaC [Haloplanus rubicundus]|uniref:Poly(3-hydroxyalkanoate) polymerase subunit PhaC n=1 Tax=Haloplanus rubicundus TaxID=1547898 RepID=A0A345EC43_9EURY|nr:class III poly(R)-hydroxyalkanoic acid synthase subunit PhaC [Haloplanus rubicundus]AXG09765.1 class III poly(R)-hydroxyalkanoic acid synthase subunit PhaC [Haloplanus rubicundus]
MPTDQRPELRFPFDILLSSQRTVLQTATEGLHKTTLVPNRLEDAASADVGQTPSEVVYTENKLELLRYESLTEHQHRVPILIVYALINRPYILDLQPDRSIVRRLLEAGHDVYLIDWHEPSELDTSLSLHDYVNRYIRNCVDEVCERSSQDAINVLGYCMGGTMSVMYAALYPEKVNALGLMATGLYFDDTGGILELWGDEKHYDPRSVTETFGNVPGEFLAAGFDQMDPVANNVTKYAHLYDRLENEDFVRNFARMEQWLSDSVDVAGEVYAQFLEDIYQDNRLYENELTIGGEHVDVTNIDMPLLQILGDYDNLVPPEASKPFNDVVGTDDATTIEYPSGHVGLAMSNGAHRDLWPEVAEWFLEHSERPTLADVIGDGIEETLGVDVETDVTVGDVDEVEVVLADDDGEIAREVITRDPTAIETFLEDALGVEIGLDTGPEGIAVEVETDEGVVTTVVKDIGEAIRTEVEEAAEEVAIAGSYDLEDVNGIGATYAKRLRAAGIESVPELAVADDARVAEAAEATEELAGTWINRARELVGPTEK